MATGYGVNPKSVFTRTDAGQPAQNIPVQGTDGQDGYDIRGWDRCFIKVTNGTNVTVAFRILGYTFEDDDLSEPVELVASVNVAVGEQAGVQVTERVARLHVEIDPAGASTGETKVVFETGRDG